MDHRAKKINQKNNAIRSLQLYREELKKFGQLSREEELRLIKEIRLKCKVSKATLIQAHLPYVVSLVKKYGKKKFNTGDLIQEGNYGLICSIKTFDETMGIKFITHASFWIEKYIIRWISLKSNFIWIPEKKKAFLKRVKKTRKTLFGQLEREPYPEEIAESMKVKEKVIIDSSRYFGKTKSIEDNFKGPDGTMIPLSEILPADDSNSIINLLQEEARKKICAGLLRLLTLKERSVIELLFGFSSDEPMNLEEIAQKLRLSPQRVSQLKEAAMKRFRRIDKLSIAPYLD